MKILASDFDNTLYLEEDLETTKRNIESIKKYVSLGNIFCIITGRNYSSLKQLLIQYNIPYTYLICEDGAKLFNNMDYCIDTTMIPKEEVEEVISLLDKENYNYYLDDGYNETYNLNDCVKIVINCTDEEEKKKIIEKVKESLNIHIYASRYHINIIHKSVNKENALKKLLNIEQLNYNDLHVIGDNENDYEMLKTFQGGVIKNHHHKLDELQKKNYDTLSDYIEELMKN